MSLVASPPSPFLSPAEWQELDALRRAISDNPASVVPSQQERFTALFARSLLGKGDMPIQ
jgi:hypothetical protein